MLDFTSNHSPRSTPLFANYQATRRFPGAPICCPAACPPAARQNPPSGNISVGGVQGGRPKFTTCHLISHKGPKTPATSRLPLHTAIVPARASVVDCAAGFRGSGALGCPHPRPPSPAVRAGKEQGKRHATPAARSTSPSRDKNWGNSHTAAQRHEKRKERNTSATVTSAAPCPRRAVA